MPPVAESADAAGRPARGPPVLRGTAEQPTGYSGQLVAEGCGGTLPAGAPGTPGWPGCLPLRSRPLNAAGGGACGGAPGTPG